MSLISLKAARRVVWGWGGLRDAEEAGKRVIMSAAGNRRFVFLSVSVPSRSIFVRARLSFCLSLAIIFCSLVSFIAGVFGGRYIFALVGNLAPAILPILIFEVLSQRLWAIDTLITQCVIGGVYAIIVIIMDSIVLSFTVTNYRYCYGTWAQNCENYIGPADFDLACHSSSTTDSPSILNVSCYSSAQYSLQFLCLSFNLIHGLLLIPYLLACYSLKLAFNQLSWEIEVTQNVVATAFSVAVVGLPEEESDDGDIVGSNVVRVTEEGKQHQLPDNTDDYHDETYNSRNYATSRPGQK